jgi:hypothetical protein
VTDANLLLGRLIPDYFPKIFGKSEKEPLDVVASRTAFERVVNEINESHDKKLSFDEIVYGYDVFLNTSFHTEFVPKIHQGCKRDHVSTDKGAYGGQRPCNGKACVSALVNMQFKMSDSQPRAITGLRASEAQVDNMPAKLQACSV